MTQDSQQFAGMAVTYKPVLDSALGDNAILAGNALILVGHDRPGSWGLNVGFRVIGF